MDDMIMPVEYVSMEEGRKRSLAKWNKVLAAFDGCKTWDDFDESLDAKSSVFSYCGLCYASQEKTRKFTFPEFCAVCPLPHGSLCHKDFAALDELQVGVDSSDCGDDEKYWNAVKEEARGHATAIRDAIEAIVIEKVE